MPFSAKSYDEVIGLLQKRGRTHRVIAGITLGASCVVFMFGVWVTFNWTHDPMLGFRDTPMPAGLKDLAPVILAINSLKILSLAAIYYLGYLLATVYRHNIRLSGHYVSRSYALRLLAVDTPVTLELMVKLLDPNVVTLDKLPTWAENYPLSSRRADTDSKSSGQTTGLIEKAAGKQVGAGGGQQDAIASPVSKV